MKNGTQESVKASVKPSARPNPRSVASPRAPKKFPTSITLTLLDNEAVKSAARIANVKPAEYMRAAIRIALGQQGAASPASVGIVDGVYSASIKSDVIELANLLMTLAFAVSILERHVTVRRRDHARRLIQEALAKLLAITGAPAC